MRVWECEGVRTDLGYALGYHLPERLEGGHELVVAAPGRHPEVGGAS